MAKTVAPTPEAGKHSRQETDQDDVAQTQKAKPVAPTPEVAKHPKMDTDGVAPAKEAAKDEPKGLPNSDRHKMETAVAKAAKNP